MAPLSQARADTLLSFLAAGLAPAAHPLVLDVGCGWAELLLQVLDAVPSATGIGVDADPAAITHGHSLAESRATAGRVELRCEPDSCRSIRRISPLRPHVASRDA